ncbi:hypothetical protein [Cellulomonas xiejunii]|uniref:Uncharacterized protein n=1 Tax=Cellulomonas xiejunii TaxID=2968083 RepID=A0ABY5KQ59_9CELL|nr:hypothetical protein [Cellulomonas xiejunii]MCC2323479.1 hypothetical protein [Cellulomonas xiejunii]UUI71591.1 hypothetical protein NP048_17655 [Cellulomonas xiejunii]
MIDAEMLLPEGWLHVPTSPGTEKLQARVVTSVVQHFVPEHLPRDRATPWRRELRKEMRRALDEATAGGARCVIMPLAQYGGLRLPGTLLVSVLEDDPQVVASDLLAELLADAGEDGLLLDVGGAPAVRIRSVVDSRRLGRAHPSWRVAYYISHPEVPGVWALATFTVLTDGDLEDPAVLAVVAMFDAVLGTLQWVEHEGGPSFEEVLAQVDALEPVGR